MRAKLFFAKGSKQVSLGLIALLMSVPLLIGASCSDGVTGSNSTTSNITSSSFGGISQLKMLDANNGWATTSSAVLKTSDGGQQWTDVTPADWEATDDQSDQSDQK